MFRFPNMFGKPVYAPSSFVGGPRHMHQCFVDAMELVANIDLLARCGRWAKHKVAAIYVQDVAPYEYLAGLPPQRRRYIFDVAAFFETGLHRVLPLLREAQARRRGQSCGPS